MIYNVKLHTVSPIHIGCDQSYTPVNFVIDTDKSTLIEFDLWDFINSLDEKEYIKLRDISENKSPIALVYLYRFYAERKNRIKGRTIPIPKELADRYRDVKQFQNESDVIREFNEFEIPKTFYNPYTGKPLIPGSSLKGSIRTAYIEGLIKEEGNVAHYRDREKYPKYTDIEEKILQGKTKTDPFRLLKLSDFEPQGEVKTEIIFQVNVRKLNNTSKESLSIPIEIIPTGNVFKGTLAIEEPLAHSGISKKLDLTELLLKTHSHYAGIFNKEIDLRKIKGFSLPNLSEYREMFKQKYFLLRLGKHSGAEAVTWEGLRKIKVKTKDGTQIMDSSTTIWLASKQKKPSNLSSTTPFGWAILEVL